MHAKENTIRTLQKLRDEYHSQLDISTLTELDFVIADLKEGRGNMESEETQPSARGLRALQMISVVISLVSNLKDLMK